jgi:hypothetical protein
LAVLMALYPLFLFVAANAPTNHEYQEVPEEPLELYCWVPKSPAFFGQRTLFNWYTSLLLALGFSFPIGSFVMHTFEAPAYGFSIFVFVVAAAGGDAYAHSRAGRPTALLRQAVLLLIAAVAITEAGFEHTVVDSLIAGVAVGIILSVRLRFREFDKFGRASVNGAQLTMFWAALLGLLSVLGGTFHETLPLISLKLVLVVLWFFLLLVIKKAAEWRYLGLQRGQLAPPGTGDQANAPPTPNPPQDPNPGATAPEPASVDPGPKVTPGASLDFIDDDSTWS